MCRSKFGERSELEPVAHLSGANTDEALRGLADAAAANPQAVAAE